MHPLHQGKGTRGKGRKEVENFCQLQLQKLHRKNSTQQHCWKTKKLVKVRVWWNTKGHTIRTIFHHVLQLDMRSDELEDVTLDDGDLNSQVYAEAF